MDCRFAPLRLNRLVLIEPETILALRLRQAAS
jgi:hypothetical protein